VKLFCRASQQFGFGEEYGCDKATSNNLTFICSYIANIISEYNQQDATILSLFISVRRSTCFRRFYRPSSGAQTCTYSVRRLSDRYCYLPLAWTGWDVTAVPTGSRLVHEAATYRCDDTRGCVMQY